jgi:hypothetical protein
MWRRYLTLFLLAAGVGGGGRLLLSHPQDPARHGIVPARLGVPPLEIPAPPTIPSEGDQLLEALWQAKVDDMPGWLRLTKTTHPALRLPVWDRWLELDAAGARKAILQGPGDVLEAGWLQEFYQVWFQRDPSQAKAKALEIKDEYERSRALNGILLVLNKTDPTAAVQLLGECGTHLPESAPAAVRALAEKDPERAASLTATLNGDSEFICLGEAIKVWSSKDPAAAANWLGRFYPARSRAALFGFWKGPPGLLLDLAGKTGSGNLVGIAHLDDGMRSFDKQLESLPAKQAFEWSMKNDEFRLGIAVSMIRKESGLEGVIQAFSGVEEGDLLLKDFLQDEDVTHPAFARKRDALEPGPLKRRMEVMTAAHLAETQPSTAIGMVLPWRFEGEAGELAADTVLINLMGNPARVIEASQDLTPAEKRWVYRRILDGEAASGILPKLLEPFEPGPEREDWIRTLAAGLEWVPGEYEPEVKLLSSLPRKEDQIAAGRGLLAERLFGPDSLPTSQWVAELPRGPFRDGAAASLSQTLLSRDPEAAWRWARDISDASLRREALKPAAAEWLKQQPEAAREAMEGSAP